MQKIKIVFLGLGGVGGFYGGKLARHYSGSDNVEVCFLARGEHLEAIKRNGIHVITDNEEFVAHPDIITNDPAQIGIADYIILSVKSYDLTTSIEFLRPCINDRTIILPLLNGCDITERIRKILPDNIVWNGSTYIVSRRTEPGVIKSVGHVFKLIFGYDKGKNEQLKTFEKILLEAGIDALLADNIRENIWKKFFFISVTASLTSYFNVGFRELTDAGERLNMTVGMSEEFMKVAKAEGVDLGEDLEKLVVNRAEALPKDTTTSMHNDLRTGNRIEVETLTGVIVKLAQKHRIDVPLYETVYNKLKEKSLGIMP